VDFLLTAKRFFRKHLIDEPLLSPNRIGTHGANTNPSTINTSVEDGFSIPIPSAISPSTSSKASKVTISG
jgi:hypothetical protein